MGERLGSVRVTLRVVRDERLELPGVHQVGEQLARLFGGTMIVGALASSVLVLGWVVSILVR